MIQLNKDIETRLWQELYRKIKAILAKDFAPQLALTIINEDLKKAIFKQKEI
jgi:hypothetical protein